MLKKRVVFIIPIPKNIKKGLNIKKGKIKPMFIKMIPEKIELIIFIKIIKLIVTLYIFIT